MWIKRMVQEHIKDDIPAILHKHYAALRDGKENVSELARVCDLSRPTVSQVHEEVGRRRIYRLAKRLYF